MEDWETTDLYDFLGSWEDLCVERRQTVLDGQEKMEQKHNGN